MLPSRTKHHKLGRLEPCIWREALFLAIKVLTKLALRRVLSTLLMLCDFFAKRDSIFSDSEIQIQSNRFRFAGFIQWLFFILSHFIVSPVNCYCYWDYAVSDQRRCWRSSEISNQAIYEYGGFCSEKISKTEITCILI